MRHPLHTVFHWQTGGGRNPSWAVRDGDWKLLGNPRDTSQQAPITPQDRLFLVDLAQDPAERNNLAPQHPERVQQMQQLHDEWVQQVQQQEATPLR